jgi:pSer/pThr/pTyr-binding forkhead associated (FHA) protein
LQDRFNARPRIGFISTTVSISHETLAKITFALEDGQEIVPPLSEHVTLGRGEDNNGVLDDERISKHHAELVHDADGSIQLFDSNSTAAPFVNGERVRSRTIRHGGKLSFGPLTAVLDLADRLAKKTTN